MTTQPLPPRNTSYTSIVKCSTCTAEVELAALADHVCISSVNRNPLTTEPNQTSRTQAFHPPRRGASLYRKERPSLPKLDSSLSNRSGLDMKEAASIAHDLGLPTPLSAGSGRRSPKPDLPYKSSKRRIAPGPRSPELPLSQDCAFPPFPTIKPKRAYTDRDLARHKSVSTSRSSSRALSRSQTYDASTLHSTSNSLQSSSSSELPTRTTSRSSSQQHSRKGTVESKRSISSATLTSSTPSDQRSISSQENNFENLSPLPSLDHSNIDENSDVSSSISPATPIWPPSSQTAQPKVLLSPFSKQYQSSAHEIDGDTAPHRTNEDYTLGGTNPEVTFDNIVPTGRLPKNSSTDKIVLEPSYKSKRPPPLNPQSLLTETEETVSRNALLPTMPLSASLGQKFTSLFNRKRSQSVNSKKAPRFDPDGPRMRALAPEPPEMPSRHKGEFGVPEETLSPESSPKLQTEAPKVKIPIEQNLSPPPPSITSPSEGVPITQINIPIENIEQDDSKVNKESYFDFSFGSEGAPEVTKAADPTKIEQNLEHMSAEVFPVKSNTGEISMQRVSTDSASSYGSIGFSNRTSSSRSSLPATDEIRSKESTYAEPDYTSSISLAVGAPLRPHSHENGFISPTDYNHKPGSLSPILETPNGGWVDSSERQTEANEYFVPPPRVYSMSVKSAEDAAPVRAPTPSGIKGMCRGCSQIILTGQKSVSSKDGRLTGRYHKECFTCRTCCNPFATADFYVHNDQPYCAHDYHVLNDTLCGACGKGIEGQFLETFDTNGQGSKKFHPKCLTCSTCKIQLGEDYFELHGRVYCERDAFRAANGPKNPYDNAPSRPSPLVREYVDSNESRPKERFPERRRTRLMMTQPTASGNRF